MKKAKKIIVEVIVPASVETVWARTQEPELHTLWDIRFSRIAYLPEKDARGFSLMDYRTKIGFGIEVAGVGRYLQNSPMKHSTFEFESADWKSIITIGRGIWQYKSCAEGTYFRTVYDYETRYGRLGKIVDRILFRPLMQLATEWGFETLRLWCISDESVLEKRANKLRFIPFFVKRYFGFKPPENSAQSWIGASRETELKSHYDAALRRAT